MNKPLDKFQDLLRELFQFDCADLDFGIYRIMNHKRDVIEKFITKDLPQAVAEELDRGALAEQSQTAAEVNDVVSQIKETLGQDALDADGNLAAAYHSTPLGKRYLTLRAEAAGGRSLEAIEASIFNHLYAFFSHYYQDGDFITKRRYSKRQKYAIPYNGEEVYLYWANHDQYYIKTAAHFTDYTFTSQDIAVHFKLQAADVEQNNVKGDKRFFLPRYVEIAWDEAAHRLLIPFEYRPLTEQENIAYGQKNQQDAIIAKALVEVPRRLLPKTAGPALAALTAEKRKNSNGQPVTFLEHHLRQYTRRNTSDFFIHKDLNGFLTRELDFYLKNELLNLDEMDASGESRSEGWFQMMRVIKAVGGRIIEFLAQIENFQKMLWEKRKFIIETQYCITAGNIAEDYYPEIAVCELQWAQWKDLFHIDEEQSDLLTASKSKEDKRIAFLKAHPTLVLDTKHFSFDFMDRLLGSYNDLDEMTDGLLVHSENFQALNLLLEKYRKGVSCVYIDPPYNTGNDGFNYKDSYRYSSWASLVFDRADCARSLLNQNGLFLCSIDDIEVAQLRFILDRTFGPEKFVAQLMWKSRQNKDNRNVTNVSVDHEYVLAYGGVLRGSSRNLNQYSNPDNDPRGPWSSANMVGLLPEDQRPNCHFDLVDPKTGISYGKPAMGWRYDANTMQRLIGEDRILWPPTPEGRPRRKVFLSELRGDYTGFSSVIGQGIYTRDGTAELDSMFGGRVMYFPKPVRLVSELVEQCVPEDGRSIDYFAGSGTTGHAVINLNREDGGRRKFILIEMADYFDTVLLPRIKKVTFTPEWKDGKPKRMATPEEVERSPRIVKYIRLESYEDALNNIAFDDASGQQVMQFDDYLLQYMLQWETRRSETLLNVEKLARLFSYKLHIHSDGETREKLVDIPETFTYMLGLHVQKRRVYDDDGRRYLVYRGQIDDRHVVVIWRETEGWQKGDFERDKEFVEAKKLTQDADEVLVNGDSFITGAKALEPIFKARMFAPVEA